MAADPVGTIDIANRLGVSRHVVAMWHQRGQMPEPKWKVSGHPCWDWKQIEKWWAKKTGRL